MDGFLDWACLQAENMLDLLVDAFGIIFGPIVCGLLWAAGFSSIGFFIWIIVYSLVIGALKLFKDATRSLGDQWRVLPDNDPKKPRVENFHLVVPVMPPSSPNQAVCDPITDSADPSKDEKKKKSSFKVDSIKKVNQIRIRLERKTARLECRHQREHKTNPRLTKKHQQTAKLKNREVEELKSRNLELSAYIRVLEESRAEILQRRPTWVNPYDEDLKIPGRIPTMSTRLPMPEFRISDVIDRQKIKEAPRFNIRFYRMPNTIVRFEASALAALSLSSTDETIDQTVHQSVNQPITSTAIVPSPVQTSVLSLFRSRTDSQSQKVAQLQAHPKNNASVSSSCAPTYTRSLGLPSTQLIAIPTVNPPCQIPKHTESPVLELPRPTISSAPLVKSSPQPLAHSPLTPPSLIHSSSLISAPAPPTASEINNWEVSQKEDCTVKESEQNTSDYNNCSGRDNDENGNGALPCIPESDEDYGTSKDENLMLLPGSGDNDVNGRDNDFPPLPDSDAGSDGEDHDEIHTDNPDNAGSVVAPVIQQLVETLSDPVPAQGPPYASSPVPIIIKSEVQGPYITLLGNQMEVDVQNENETEEEHLGMYNAAKDEMEVDIESNKTEDDTGKDKMETDIENDNGATTDKMLRHNVDSIPVLEDLDMADASQKIQRPRGDDVEMGDGSIPLMASTANVSGKQNAQPTITKQPSTPLPNKHRSQQGTLSPQALNNVSDETMSEKVPSPDSASRNERRVIIVRRRPADPMVQRKPRTSRQKQRPQQPTTPTSLARNSPTVCISGPPSLVSDAASEGTVTLFPVSRARNSPKTAPSSFKPFVRLFPDRPARKHKYDEVAAVDEDYDGDADLSMPFDFNGPPRKVLSLPKRALQTLSAADEESRRQRAHKAKRRWLLAQEQEAAAAPDPTMEQFRNRPPPIVASQGVSARDNRLLLSGSSQLRRELLHRLQALWPLLPKSEADRVRLNTFRSKSLAEWRKLLNPAGKHTLPENTYIPRDAFEREAAELMKKVVELMTKLRVIPEVGTLLETWRECVARQEPLPEPEDN
ncbi:hypothetical protein LZ32DRAFT_694252 [Colletotrichum eremochloae]|nr:hypothetical protein LZ32DRAFT_694252 [Colletotrichum eremochloae]